MGIERTLVADLAAAAEGDLGALRRAADAWRNHHLDGAALSLAWRELVPEGLDGPWTAAWWSAQRRSVLREADALRGEIERLLPPVQRAARERSCLLHDWIPSQGWVWPAEMQ